MEYRSYPISNMYLHNIDWRELFHRSSFYNGGWKYNLVWNQPTVRTPLTLMSYYTRQYTHKNYNLWCKCITKLVYLYAINCSSETIFCTEGFFTFTSYRLTTQFFTIFRSKWTTIRRLFVPKISKVNLFHSRKCKQKSVFMDTCTSTNDPLGLSHFRF